ncbi:hypothetical protein QCN29_26935 [Streptomyces sp. HNM0663]|uniref:Uncharacterized protein n=1 Tax=Streptomyces chengmaiensis TaxID=3040919 RepID=A0ABT6HUE2_9ACTN|nr:hypothetical protein [Streptomyces chengmaiensis]MDH2392348.1 hypothetical protein [Streptomyces chengmaiensis]
MNSTTNLPLFGEDTEQTETGPQPQVHFGMATAAAHLVPYEDSLHGDGQPHALLVVDCPFCDHQHIHPAGAAAAPRVCPRRSRCVGQPTGTYYFPAVHQ